MGFLNFFFIFKIRKMGPHNFLLLIDCGFHNSCNAMFNFLGGTLFVKIKF